MRVLPSLSSYQMPTPSLTAWLTLLLLFLVLPAIGQSDCDNNLSYCLYIQSPDGVGLPGVNVVIDDKFYGSSDLQGMVAVPRSYYQDTVEISYVGFRPNELVLQDLGMETTIIVLQPEMSQLGEVIIFGRKSTRQADIAQQIKVLSTREIKSLHAPSAVDFLEKSGTAYVQKSQMGGGSPILRGMEANRILLVSDKVRMNNAIYRSGHLQNSITLDPYLIESIEVALGPSSLLYGSDALGGVIHYRTRSPGVTSSLGERRREINYGVSYGSAAEEKGLHLDINFGRKDLGFLTSISFTDFGDLMAGKRTPADYPSFGTRPFYAERVDGADILRENPDTFLQVGTAYNQLDITQKVSYRYSDDLLLKGNLQYSTSSDIPRYDMLTEPGDSLGSLRWARWDYGPQNRVLTSIEAQWSRPSEYWDEAIFILSTQAIDEQRITRRFGSQLESDNSERVRVWSATADFSKRLEAWLGGVDLRYGADLQWNRVRSTAVLTRLEDTLQQSIGVLSRYPDDRARQTALSIYAMGDKKLPAYDLTLQAGVRMGIESIGLRYADTSVIRWPSDYLEGISRSVGVLSASAGAIYQYDDLTRLRASIASAYRNPNIDDQGKIRVKNGLLQIPNLELKPERNYSIDIHIDRVLELPFPFSDTRVSAGGYYSLLQREIVRELSALPSGDSIILVDGQQLRTITNSNGQSARIRGLYLQWESKVLSDWSTELSLNYTRGVSTLANGEKAPAAHIPPVYGLFRLAYKQERWTARLDILYNGAKPAERFAVNSSDNLELATPDGSLGWTSWSLYSDITISKDMSLSVGIENLWDKHYRTFSSGVSAPGRNLSLRLRGTIR